MMRSLCTVKEGIRSEREYRSNISYISEFNIIFIVICIIKDENKP